jgi:SNF2 family DNA or RNA helicase
MVKIHRRRKQSSPITSDVDHIPYGTPEVITAFQTAKEIMKQKKFGLYEPYQSKGVNWMIEMEKGDNPIKGGLLCDEPGLGKTIQTIGVMVGNPVKRTLIIVPTSLINQWKQALEQVFDRPIIKHHGPSRAKNIRTLLESDPIAVVTSHSLVFKPSRDSKFEKTILHNLEWDRVVVDESHFMKNHRTRKAKGIKAIRAKYRWAITGTPVQNIVDDLVSQFIYLQYPSNELRQTIRDFRDNPKEHEFNKYILRRTKSMVEKFNPKLKLPSLTVNIAYADFQSEEERAFYQKVQTNVKEEFQNLINSNNKSGTQMVVLFELLLRLRQAIIHPQLLLNGYARKFDEDYGTWQGSSSKFELLKTMISKHPDEKSLIFCQFTEEIDLIIKHLVKLGHTVRKIDGRMSLNERSRVIEDCNNTELGVDILLIQIKSGGVGLNLQMFSRVYITSPDWNPSNELQAMARAHRIGQKRPVVVQKIILVDRITGKPTIDEKILAIQNIKRHLMADILSDPTLISNGIMTSKSLNKLSIEQIKMLLS